MIDKNQAKNYLKWFRHSAPYINAHRDHTFVILFNGEAAASDTFPDLVHDFALLNSLGVKLVLVHGATPQIDAELAAKGQESKSHGCLRITDDNTLIAVKNAVGSLRVELEALLSMGLPNSPMHGADLRVATGNFITARPLGIREGTDFCHTGEVRRVDVEGIQQRLEDGNIVLLSCLGYSPTGEVFNLSAEDVATAAAVELGADKLLSLIEGPGLHDQDNNLVKQLSASEAEEMLSTHRELNIDMQRQLIAAIHACRNDVARVHLISRENDGALLMELFTRSGVGTMISSERFEQTRPATVEDVPGILEIIEPLEKNGVMVKRSREQLELEIDQFTVMSMDGMITGVAALYPYLDEANAELACLAIHPDFRREGRGDHLLQDIVEQGNEMNLDHIFTLTTRASHWFVEREFSESHVDDLPPQRKHLYNFQRNSKSFLRVL